MEHRQGRLPRSPIQPEPPRYQLTARGQFIIGALVAFAIFYAIGWYISRPVHERVNPAIIPAENCGGQGAPKSAYRINRGSITLYEVTCGDGVPIEVAGQDIPTDVNKR